MFGAGKVLADFKVGDKVICVVDNHSYIEDEEEQSDWIGLRTEITAIREDGGPGNPPIATKHGVFFDPDELELLDG